MSELPPLPAGWVWSQVDEVGDVQLGRQRSPEHHRGENMRPYLRVANVFEDRIDLSDVMEMNFTPAEFESYRLEHGDILLNEGQSRELVGRPAMYRGELPKGCFTNSLIRFRARPCVIPEYALGLFRHYLHSGRFQRIAKITTNIAHLGAGRFAKIEFPLPPLGEQSRIVAKLQNLNARASAAREALEKVPTLLERFRQSVLAAAFRGDLTAEWRKQNPDVEPASVLLERIRAERRRRWEEAEFAAMRTKNKQPASEEWKERYCEPESLDLTGLDDLPSTWQWTTIGSIGETLNGRQLAKPQAGGRTRAYLRIANIKDDEIDFADLHDMACDADHAAKYRLEPGDILLSAGQSLWKVGQSALYREGMPEVGFQKNLFRFRAAPGVLPTVAQLVFRAWVRRGVFRERSSISTNLAYMSTDKFEACPFPVMPMLEQQELIRRVESLFAVVREAEVRLVHLAASVGALEQAILAKAFRGELVPQDPNDEPASVLLDRIRAERTHETSTRKPARRKKADEPALLQAAGSPEADPPPPPPPPARPTPASKKNGARPGDALLASVLAALKRDALHRIADARDLALADRRSLDAARAGILQARLGFDAVLEPLKREELQAVCRALDLDDRGRSKEELRARILGAQQAVRS